MTFQIKKGDTSPALKAKLINPDGSPAALSLAEEVEFYLNDPKDNEKISDDLDGNVSILNASDGQVQYQWKDGQTDNVGQKEAEFVVTFENGTVQSYPNNGFLYINILKDVETI
jgi:hypothetical protein